MFLILHIKLITTLKLKFAAFNTKIKFLILNHSLRFFFFDKNKTIFIHSNWEYIIYNNMFIIVKNVKGESANKLTTPKLIAYNDKMPTNNMINSKSPKYSCFRICNVNAQIIDWICNWLKFIFRYEENEHHNKTQNQAPHRTTNNTTSHSDDEITKNTK